MEYKKISISYCILACVEVFELKRLLTQLLGFKDANDEIIVVLDSDNTIDDMRKMLALYPMIKVFENPLNRDFAKQKNFATAQATGDYIFNIDADEYPAKQLTNGVKLIIESNPEVDAIWVPRVNTVEGLTQDHIKKWGWKVNENGWVNWPDSQLRIYKRKPSIYWIKPVHETLTGFEQYAVLPQSENYALYHPKHIDRQEQQNNFYSTIN